MVLRDDAAGGRQVVSANPDIKNPNAQQDFEHLPPEQLVADITAKEKRIVEIMAEIEQVLKTGR